MAQKTKPKRVVLTLTEREAGMLINGLEAMTERAYFEDTVKLCEKLIRKVNRARKLRDDPDLV